MKRPKRIKKLPKVKEGYVRLDTPFQKKKYRMVAINRLEE